MWHGQNYFGSLAKGVFDFLNLLPNAARDSEPANKNNKGNPNLTTPSMYPVASGHRGVEASVIAAAAVDADPMRKLNCQITMTMAVLLYADLCADDLAAEAGEHPLYARPIASALCRLGVLRQGRKKISATFGRLAHVLEPNDALVGYLARRFPNTRDDLLVLVRAFIMERIGAHRGDR